MRAVHRVSLPIIATLGLAIGCKREASGPKPVVVEVISEPAQIEAAKKAWVEDRERKLVALLQEPDNIRFFDKESVELVRGQRERSKAALEQLRDDGSKLAKTRIDAIYALRLLDVSPSSEQLAKLGRLDDEAAMTLLFELRSHDIYPPDKPLPNALSQFVIDCIRSQHKGVRTAAVHLAGSRKIAEAGDIVVQQMRQQRELEVDLLKAAARLRPSNEVLDRLQQQLKPIGPYPVGGALGAIADLSEAAQDPALKEKAARVCAEYLQRERNHPWLDADSMFAIDAIAAVQPSQTAQALLQNIVRSAQWQLVRESALARLERIDANVARELSAQTGLKPGSETAKPERRSQPLSLQQLTDLCTRHGLLTPTEAEKAAAAYASKVKADEREPADILSLLHVAGRLLAFDVETGMVQNRHDLLIAQFAEASAGVLRPEAALERYEDPSAKIAKRGSKEGRWVEVGKGKYNVQFIHQGKLYRFAPNDLGDWYDVAAVVKAIHQSLADAGVTERFIALASGGQDAQFIFGKPAAIQGVAKELGLQLESDLDSARRSGTAYEEKVFQDLKKQ